MAKFVVEFSPPQKNKSEPDVTESVTNYRMILAPFQKQTQVEFTNIQLKEIAVRFLTVVNPLEKSGQFVLPPPSDGVYFDIYKFTLEPNSQCNLSITWQPSEYGNMRKLIKIEQVDSNRKYDFVILGNCNGPPLKKFKGATSTYSKSKKSNIINKQSNCGQKKITTNKSNVISCKTELIPLLENPLQIPETISADIQQSPNKRQTYLVVEKENLPFSKKNILGRDTILTSPERSMKRPDQTRQDHVFNNHFNLKNLNKSSSPMSDDSLEKPSQNIINKNSQLIDSYSTPLKSTENLQCPINIKNQLNCNDQTSFDVTDGPLYSMSSNSSPFKPKDPLSASSTCNLEDINLTEVSLNLHNNFIKTPKNFETDAINLDSFFLPLEVEESSNFRQIYEQKSICKIHPRTMVSWSGTKPKRPSFTIKNSSYYKCSPKISMMPKNKSKQYSTIPRTSCLRAPKLDNCDQYLKCLANPELLYHNNGEDPFLKMSQFYEAEWLNRQESDMIRWLNALLTPTDKLVDEEESGDLEKAVMAWVDASKTIHKNKPMQFATQKDLFAAQIYRQSPQQWSALRKATTNLITSSSVTTVLSKLTISIEKDLITVRDDRQIHLDLSLKKKIIDLLKCYNPLWLRIGLEAIYGQIVHVKPGSNDLNGIGWFVRKYLFNNDFVKQNFIKNTVLQVNLPSYNVAMKKFILRKILMLIYFLDRAKEHQLIRHNPCLFKIDSSYKSSYDLLMGFCADMVTAHGDIMRRLRNIGYNLTHKQTHLDEVNYAVKSLNDLRDGTRITRVVEILFKGNPLSQKLRLPAISKLQKIHNVNLALTRISEHITIDGNISTRDIVNGHREKILSLFWQIIYKYLTPRFNNAAIKIQNWWRNSSLKLVILKRIRAKQVARRHKAAAKIQAYVRGYLSRKQWPCLLAKLLENREMLHEASTKIKRYLKGKLKVLTNERKLFIILRRTVVFVQRKFRAKMAMVKERQDYLKAKQSVVLIQKVFRGYSIRKNWTRIKNDLIMEKTKRIAAVGVIKRALRRNLPLTQVRLDFLELKRIVLNVERLYAANKSTKSLMVRYAILRKNAVFFQRKFRANVAMKRQREYYLKVKQSSLLIQKTFRGYLVRKRWPDTRNRLKSEKKERVEAINTVKRALRRNLPKTQDRLDFLKFKYTVVYVQRVYIANKCMKTQLERYLSLKRTTVFVQQKFRANVAMKRERESYLTAKRSALMIQKVFRGFIVRKRWTDIRNHLLCMKKERIKAVNVVIRALRRNLPETRDRTAFVKLKSAVLIVQRTWRSNRLMKAQREWYTTSQYATVFVQRKFRAMIAMRTGRREYLKAKRSAVLIQKSYRGYITRKHWPSVKNHLTAEKTRRARAANVIKRVLRKNLPPTRDQLYYEDLRRSAVVIQRRFRANVAMTVHRDEFRTLKRNVIVLQQRFRAKRIMEAVRNGYVVLRTRAIQLQSAIRGYLTRKRWPELRNRLQANRKRVVECADTIKRALRKRLPLTEDRIRFLELKYAAMTVQRRFRANSAAKRQKNIYLRLKTAIVGLQNAGRGYLFRERVWPALRSTLLENRAHLVWCSDVIKRSLRRRLPMTEDRAAFLKLKLAATVLQRRYRARRAMVDQRRKYTQIKAAVVRLQSVTRGYVFRQRQWPAMKTELTVRRQMLIRCADTVKRALRKRMAEGDRRRFLAFKSTVIAIQRGYRMRQQSRQYQKLRSAVVTIQQRFRSNMAARRQRSEYVSTRVSVILLQAHVRGYLARQRWPEKKRALKIRLKRSTDASNVIKRFLRRCLPTTLERLEYLKLRQAVIAIQARYRATIAAKLVRTEYLQLRRYTIVLQRRFRALLAIRAAIVLQAHVRGYLSRQQWPRLKDRLETNRKIAIDALRKKNDAASKIQAAVRGFLARKKMPVLKDQLHTEKQTLAATCIQAFWKGHCVRKQYQCKRETMRMPRNNALTLGKRHDDVVDKVIKHKRRDYSYIEHAAVFWNLETCTSLSKELCIKTAKGPLVDHVFQFLQISNQSQPSLEARVPAIRVLINLLKYHGTCHIIWSRTIKAQMVQELIKIMKASCGKFGIANKLYCSIATWMWIALQDTEKKQYIRNVPGAITDFKFMMDTLNRKRKTHKVNKEAMVLPSTRPAWFIGSKCQKCFESDLYGTIQVYRMLNIIK